MIKAIIKQGYETPTKIQKKVIPLLNKGIDVIAASKSGTGKTASYILPMLNKINSNLNYENRVLRGLIIVPTRELVEQVSKTLADFGEFLKVKHTKVMGGASRTKQTKVIESGIDIVVATAGRLLDLSKDEILNLSSVNFIVLDEADTMLEMGFLEEIEEIFSLCSPKRQIIMCSATISQNIKKLAKEFLQEPVAVQVHDRRDRVDLINHKAYKIDKKKKKELVTKLIKDSNYKQILLFVNKKDAADAAIEHFNTHGVKAAAIHGEIEYKQRVQAIKDFRNKKIQVLIATDIAARGLDIEKLPLVINYTLPESTDDFTHRVGRTGRAGNRGEVITILTTEDYNRFTKIERDLKLNVKREVHESFPLRDRQPRQKVQAKKKLSEKKSRKTPVKKEPAKSKKSTKRDLNRSFRRK
ncbi:DEAD/DEAH box helicase [Halarcobacter anaerophilus]|uniref:DEAD/DEAH box helicase n=1 Tax=Halarcobacter anaerophilus TaxID=877500 RepID=UPI000699085B|nr:DEAD/DEAH box helicase [Halarcobacter anaerophilus]